LVSGGGAAFETVLIFWVAARSRFFEGAESLVFPPPVYPRTSQEFKTAAATSTFNKIQQS
jgi:hypothetical protein